MAGTGWLLLISEDFELGRVLAALLISISFLALRLTINPQKRCGSTPSCRFAPLVWCAHLRALIPRRVPSA
eukprot:3573688-Prymnesium_polylepis.3